MSNITIKWQTFNVDTLYIKCWQWNCYMYFVTTNIYRMNLSLLLPDFQKDHYRSVITHSRLPWQQICHSGRCEKQRSLPEVKNKELRRLPSTKNINFRKSFKLDISAISVPRTKYLGVRWTVLWIYVACGSVRQTAILLSDEQLTHLKACCTTQVKSVLFHHCGASSGSVWSRHPDMEGSSEYTQDDRETCNP
jgi:hypothetical protein